MTRNHVNRLSIFQLMLKEKRRKLNLTKNRVSRSQNLTMTEDGDDFCLDHRPKILCPVVTQTHDVLVGRGVVRRQA
jgi:hypothetical protein